MRSLRIHYLSLRLLINASYSLRKCKQNISNIGKPIKHLIWRLTSERLVRSVHLFVCVYIMPLNIILCTKLRTMCLLSVIQFVSVRRCMLRITMLIRMSS